MIKSADPYLNFLGTTQEAFEFYRSVFGGEFSAVIRFRDLPDNPMGVPDDELDKIAHVALPLNGSHVLMGTDVVESWSEGFVMGTNGYIHLEVDSASEAERIFEALGRGGRTRMPLERTEWAERFGDCTDRYGVQWMVSYTGSVVFP